MHFYIRGITKMTISETIKILCVYMNVSVSKLARRISQSPQNFNANLKRGSVSQQEMHETATAWKISNEQSFILPNEDRITE